ncbi:YkvA family protein [Hyphobacterium sp.]|uniref:YkvA family protein n=1 Tax=Hyphobacterium sp. TaxID=2004662 RepID=UPI003BAAC8BD
MDYSRHYSGRKFQDKLKNISGVGVLVEQAGMLYGLLRDPETPRWVKATCLGALGYLILPTDAVADVIPVAGYLDDAGMITAAIASLGTQWQQKQDRETTA